MRNYNIPNSWVRDIATCGTSSHRFYRNQLWHDWTETQRQHAIQDFSAVFERLEEFVKLKDNHADYFGSSHSCWWADIDKIIAIDLGKQYTKNQMVQFVNDAITSENNDFEEELDWTYNLGLDARRNALKKIKEKIDEEWERKLDAERL